jgi:hypothetical protein
LTGACKTVFEDMFFISLCPVPSIDDTGGNARADCLPASGGSEPADGGHVSADSGRINRAISREPHRVVGGYRRDNYASAGLQARA